MAISSYSNPIPEIIDGLLRGHQLGLQMQQAARADQEFKTQQAMHNQQMSMQDIMNQHTIQGMGRLVDPATGMVTDTTQLPSMPITPGSSGGTSQSPDLYNLPTRPGPTMTNQAGISAPIAPGSQGAPPDVSNLPITPGPSIPGQSVTYQRKPDKSRLTAPYKTLSGNTIQSEAYTPEEVRQRDIAQQTALYHAQEQAKLDEQIRGMGPLAEAQFRINQQQADSVLKLRGVEVPAELAAWHHTAPGTKVLPEKLEAMWKEYDAAKAPKEVGQGAALVNPITGKPVYSSPGKPQEVPPGGKLVDPVTGKVIFAADPKDTITETGLALRAAQGDKDAEAALLRLDKSKLASRPVTQITIPGLGPGTAAAANPQLTGEDFLKTLPPGTAAQVKQTARGFMKLPPIGSRGPAAYLRDAVLRYDPNFNEERAQIRRAFATGPDATNIGNLNTATVHLDQMAEAAKAMQNGSWQPGNELYNYIRTKLGSSAVTNYNAVMNAFAGEAANALKGSATDPEIAHVMSTLASNMSPQQAAGVATTNLHTLRAKLNTYQERYNQQMGVQNDSVWSPILPSAQAVFQKYGLDAGGPRGIVGPIGGGGGPRGPLPQGGGKALDPQTANQFYDAAGQDPNRARALAIQNGWKVQ